MAIRPMSVKTHTEIGARGKNEDVSKVLTDLREINSDFWWQGMYDEEGTKSIACRNWGSSDSLDEATATAKGICQKLSEDNPDVEVFFLVMEEAVYTKHIDEIRYAEYIKGEFVRGETFISHDRWTETVGDCVCVSKGDYFNKYPNETPFADCPLRLDPPTAWAVENIMEAHERIGMR